MGPDNPEPSYLNQGSKLTAYGAICLTGILLGLIPIFIGGLSAMNPLLITLMRSLVAFMVLLVVVLFRKKKDPIIIVERKKRKIIWCFFALYGALSIAFVSAGYILSLKYSGTPANAIMAVFTTAPITTIVVLRLMKKNTTQHEWIGFVCCVVGCFLVNYQDMQVEKFTGLIFGVLAGVCYGFYPIFCKKIIEIGYKSLFVRMFWQFAFSLGANIVIYFLFNSLFVDKGNGVDLEKSWKMIVWPVLGLGVVSTFLPYALYNYGIGKGAKQATASMLTILEPITVSVLSWPLLGFAQWLGIGMVLFAAAWLLFSVGKIEENLIDRIQ